MSFYMSYVVFYGNMQRFIVVIANVLQVLIQRQLNFTIATFNCMILLAGQNLHKASFLMIPHTIIAVFIFPTKMKTLGVKCGVQWRRVKEMHYT